MAEKEKAFVDTEGVSEKVVEISGVCQVSQESMDKIEATIDRLGMDWRKNQPSVITVDSLKEKGEHEGS